MDCQICCEKLNKSTRLAVKCNYCEFTNCRSCFQRYLLDSHIDAHCMNCKKIFTRDFLADNCTNVFITKNLKTHRENILLDREKSLLPTTQPYVILEKTKRKIDSDISKLYQEQENIKRLLAQKSNEIAQLHVIRRNLRFEIVGTSEVKKFIRKCPIADCRGFLSSRWKCGICETNICNKCNEVKDIFHIDCDPDKVKTMELINKDTKPCPKCGTMIFKIDGCDQMFCVDCQTAFSWNRGTIETGIVHNPHYYEFQRRNNNGTMPRNAGDIPCGGTPDYRTINSIMQNLDYTDTKITNIHQTIVHIQHVEIRRYTPYEDQEIIKRDLRVKYLLNEIDEPTLKAILQQNEKSNQKLIDYRNICQMFCDVGSDIFRQIVNEYTVVTNMGVYRTYNMVSPEHKDRLSKYLNEQLRILEGLITYFNENIKKVGKIYKCVYPGITDNCRWVQNYETYLKKNAT